MVISGFVAEMHITEQEKMSLSLFFSFTRLMCSSLSANSKHSMQSLTHSNR